MEETSSQLAHPSRLPCSTGAGPPLGEGRLNSDRPSPAPLLYIGLWTLGVVPGIAIF